MSKKIFEIQYTDDFNIEELGDQIAKWLKKNKLTHIQSVIIEIIDK